jgi:Protein of unknown function (DUF3375)
VYEREVLVSDISGELARVCEAFRRPTLSLLLNRKWSELVLAIFRSSFSRDQRSVGAERLHAQVDAFLEELHAVGVETPQLGGRALCLQWMNDQWLFRSVADNGDEEYSLTSHALEALDLVQSMTRERALISESRINMILETVHRWAMEANPDREARIDRLSVQIEQLTSERDRLLQGGEITPASDDRMLDGYANLIDLIGQLPSDFKRVEESVQAMHRKVITDFRSEDRPIGEVIDEYLRKTDELTMLTPEGRAFEGAFALLRDDALLLDLKTDLQFILDHPFAAVLTPGEQREFRGTVTVIRRGIDDVLAQRSRLTATLRDHIVNHDILRDRELDGLLRQIGQQLETWMQTAGPRSAVPVAMIPEPLEIQHLRHEFYDPASMIPPPPLEDVSDSAPETPDIAAIRAQGGPSFPELREALMMATRSGDAGTVGELFSMLPDSLRRPVEILGLFHLADTGAIDVNPNHSGGSDSQAAGPSERFDAIRADGSTRQFLGSRVPLRPADSSAPCAARGETHD